jgi:ATP-dependent Lon protease
MPKEVREKANKELGRLAKMSSYNPEAAYIRNYLEWLTDLPWKAAPKIKIDMKKAQTVLDGEHYGLKKVKERIMEYLAVYKLAGKLNGAILCFSGPPGTGKTSIGKSIAKALGRKFVKVSLGGIRDEAEIRGHRRTYVGSMPGRMIQSIKQAVPRTRFLCWMKSIKLARIIEATRLLLCSKLWTLSKTILSRIITWKYLMIYQM